jgi:hypothetical protein
VQNALEDIDVRKRLRHTAIMTELESSAVLVKRAQDLIGTTGGGGYSVCIVGCGVVAMVIV